MKALVVILAAAAALAVPAAAMAMTERVDARVTIQARGSRFGQILFDGRGYVLYAFTADRRNRSNCYGACARAWPVYFRRTALRAGPGARRSLIGTTRRRNGRLQVTYAGKPLYYYVGDNAPGVIRCQNVLEFGGLWLVVRGSGAYVRGG